MSNVKDYMSIFISLICIILFYTYSYYYVKYLSIITKLIIISKADMIIDLVNFYIQT